MYSDIEPYDQGLLAVGDGNSIYWECCGNPNGKPAVYLHGTAGWVLSLNNPLAAPTEAQIQGTLTSWSLGGGGGHFVGGGASGNNVGIAVAVGVYNPGQAAGGFSWGFGPYGPFHALPKYGRCTK